MWQPVGRVYPPKPQDAPWHIDVLALTPEQKEELLSYGICQNTAAWGIIDKVCHCYRCGYKWRATNSLSAPLRCKKCKFENWNVHVLFCCRWCRYVFASATGREPYDQYLTCPNCKKSYWLPKLRPSSSWKAWFASVLAAIVLAVGFQVGLDVLARPISGSNSYGCLLVMSCLWPVLNLTVPFALIYKGLVGDFSRHAILFVLGVAALVAGVAAWRTLPFGR